MKTRRKWVFFAVLSFSSIATASKTPDQPPIYSGVVTAVLDGSLYMGGISHSIATVNTDQGPKRVAVSTMGVMQPLQVGESLSFSGPTITVNSESVINTKDGFVFQPAEKSMAAVMVDMQSKMQAQVQEATRSRIPNAVPTMLMETPEQMEEGAAKRRTDLLLTLMSVVLTLMSVVLALLAFERMQHFAVAPIRWIKSKVRRPGVVVDKPAAQQMVQADGPASGGPTA